MRSAVRCCGVTVLSLLVFTLLGACAPSAHAAILRVKANAPGPVHNGTSWAAAYTTVGAALAAAVSGDEVWVAGGTYIERLTLRNGVGLYGGFAGTETSRTQRNPTANVTILDGANTGFVSVITIPTGTGGTTTIDGFTIRYGDTGGIRSNGQSTLVVGGNAIVFNNGPGVLSSSTTICTANTIANNNGSGIAAQGSATVTDNTVSGNIASGITCGGTSILTGNTISNNGNGISFNGTSMSAADNVVQNNNGIGIYCEGSSTVLSSNTAKGNTSYGIYLAVTTATVRMNHVSENAGGGLYCTSISGSDATIAENHLFGNGGYGLFMELSAPAVLRNSLYNNQGGIYCHFSSASVRDNLIRNNTGYGMWVSFGSPTIANNTLTENASTQAAIRLYGTSAMLVNNVVAFNSSGVLRESGGGPTLRFNCIYGNRAFDWSGFSTNPIGVFGNISDDPQFVDLAGGNLRLLPSSPCVDTGDNNAVLPGELDLDGNPRIQNGRVDMGAYERRFSTPVRLVLLAQPGGSRAGTVFSTQPVVAAVDDGGDTVSNYTGPVTVRIRAGTGAAGASLLGTATWNAVNGVATFSNLAIDRPGTGYVLEAVSGSLTPAASSPFDVAVVASRLVYNLQPGTARAGLPFGIQPRIRAVDAWGNTDTAFTGPVTITLKPGTGTAGAILIGTTTVNAVAGVASFTNIGIDRPGSGFVLVAAAPALASAESVPLFVSVLATRLVLTVQPSGGRTGVPLSSQPVVRAQDAWGNTDTAYTGPVIASIKAGTGTSGAGLFGTVAVNAVAGVASFSGIGVNRPGSGYVLLFTSGSLSPVDSSSFNVAAVATRLVFDTQPGSARTGLPFGIQPRIRAVDAWGNTDMAFTAPISLVIKPGTGTAGAALSGTATVNAVNGVATFSNVALNRPGSGYVLTASSGSLLPADSDPFAVAVVATRLAFTAQPTGARAGQAFSSQIILQARDAWGNVDTSFIGSVVISIEAGTGNSGASLLGTTTVNAVNGVATFSNLAIDRPGMGYVLEAVSGSLMPTASSPFDVAVVATRWSYDIEPAMARAGLPFGIQPRLRAVDAWGNTDTAFTGPVTLTIKQGTGTAGASLTGSTTVNAVSGVAALTDISIDRPGTGYVLEAAGGSLIPAESALLNVSVVATRLVFDTQPGSARTGQPFGAQPRIRAVDVWGNTDTEFTGSVSLAIKSGTGAAGAALSGAATVNAVNGVATFSNVALNQPGSGYVLTASGGSLLPADSDPFAVAVVATKIAFTVQPAGARTGQAFPVQPILQAQDEWGNVDASYTGIVSVSIRPGTGTSGASLLGTTNVQAAGGTAAYASLAVDRPGSGYVLRAASGSLAPAESAPFDVGVVATRLAFEAQPGAARAGIPFGAQPRVRALDAWGNPDTGYSGPVTLSIKSGTGAFGAGLLGTVTANAVDGVASFTGVGIDRAGTGYILIAAGGGLAATESVLFDVAAVATRLAFTLQPSGGAAGQPFTNQPVVAAQDASANTDPTFNGPVTLAIQSGTGTSGAILVGTTTVTAVDGVATFSGLSIDRKGAGYILAATGGGLTPAQTQPFSVPLIAGVPIYRYPSGDGIAVDGHIGYYEWAGAPELLMGAAIQDVLPGLWTGPADYTGRARVQWNETDFLFTLQVTDDFVSFPNTSDAGLWARDGLEIFIGLNDPQDPNRTIYDIPGDYQIVVTADQDTNGNLTARWNSQQAPQTINGNPETLFVWRTEDGYAMEGAIPWSALVGASPPGPGQTIRFNLMGKDRDRTTPGEDSAFSLSGLPFPNVNPSRWTTAVMEPSQGIVPPVSFLPLQLPSGYEGHVTDADSVFEIQDGEGQRISDFNDPVHVTLQKSVQDVWTTTMEETFPAVGGLLRFETPLSGFGRYSVVLEYGATISDAEFHILPVVTALTVSGLSDPWRAGTPTADIRVRAENSLEMGIGGQEIVVRIKDGTGAPGAQLLGTLVKSTELVPASDPGWAVFADLAIDRPGSGYVLVFETQNGLGNVISVESPAFDVLPVATRLAFTSQPSGRAGQALSPAPTVAVRDEWGNTVTDFIGTVTLSLKPNTGIGGATLSGSTTVGVADGIAAFPEVSIDRAGTGYVLVAQSGSFSVESAPFDVAPAGVAANRVYGQADFGSSFPNDGGVSPASLALPSGLALDHAGLHVSDAFNHRVLFYPGNDTRARRLYGQPAFLSGLPDAGGLSRNSLEGPAGVFASGRDLFIADSANNRVLFYEPGDVLARRVYGQFGFTSDGSLDPPTASSLRTPSAVAADASGVTIADTGNNRVLFFPTGSSTATRVLGQPDMSGSLPNNGGVSATSLSGPRGLALGQGGLFVADTGNNRVLFFPGGAGTATRVYGQPDFTGSAVNNGGISASSLNGPSAVAVTGEGVFIADTGNSRVLFYPGESAIANRVYGQPDFRSGTANSGGVSAASLNGPRAVAAGAAGAAGVFIADTGNHRVLGYGVSDEGPRLYGDTDGNGVVDMADVLLLLKGGSGLSGDAHLQAGDVGPTYGAQGFSDGRISLLDAARLARHLQSLEPDWP